MTAEVRDEIYNLSLSYDGIRAFIKTRGEGFRDLFDEETDSTDFFRTPGVILVNKQISQEGIERLRRKPLIINSPPHLCSDGDLSVLPVLLPSTTLMNIIHVQLVMPELQHLEFRCVCDGVEATICSKAWFFLVLELSHALEVSQVLEDLRITCGSEEYTKSRQHLPDIVRTLCWSARLEADHLGSKGKVCVPRLGRGIPICSS